MNRVGGWVFMETRIQSVAHLVVSLYAIFLFLEGVRRRRDIERFNYVSLVNAGIGAWNFLLFLYYGLDTPDSVYIISQWGFVSVNVAIFGLFFFSWRVSFGRAHDRLLLLFAAVPVVTCLLSVTSSFQPLFLSGNGGFDYLPMRELVILHGPWFVVHSISSYLLITVSLVLLVIQYLRARRKNRTGMLLFVVSTVIFSVFLFLSNFTNLKGLIQPYAFFGHLLCASIFYWATFLDEDESVVFFGKNRFYDSVGLPVLMFNASGELLQLNGEAQRYFDEFGFPTSKYLPCDRLFDESFFSRIDFGSGLEEDSSFFVQNVKSAQTLYVGQRDILDGRRKRIGYSLSFYDLSKMDSFVKDLEKRAYFDTLCQCQNRTCFEQRRGKILDNAARPLVLFVADVDNLKAVNDQYGHATGDKYIRSCVDILRKVTRSTDTLFRIGGDEFVFFLSGLDEAGLLRVQNAIAAELSALNMEYPSGLSLGYSVIGEGDSDFEKHFNIADGQMFRQKRQKKGTA
jgi:diguanylate cyclase (GGDEF)-like protein